MTNKSFFDHDKQCNCYSTNDKIDLEIDEFCELDINDELPPKPTKMVVEEFVYNLKSNFIQSLSKLFKNRKQKTFSIEGSCAQCGECCKSINLETSNGWIKTEEEYDSFIAENPEYSRFKIIGRDNDKLIFKCDWLLDNNSCKDHKNRLDICHKYPKESIIDDNSTLHKNCGYYKKYN